MAIEIIIWDSLDTCMQHILDYVAIHIYIPVHIYNFDKVVKGSNGFAIVDLNGKKNDTLYHPPTKHTTLSELISRSSYDRT